MSAIFLGLARTILSLSSSPLTFKLKIISSLAVFAPYEEVAKALPVVRLPTHKLLVSVDDINGLEHLVTTFADKHMVTVLPKFVLVRCWQRLESMVTNIIEVTFWRSSCHSGSTVLANRTGWQVADDFNIFLFETTLKQVLKRN